MWTLVLIAMNANMIFTIPGYSSEQTCTAGAKEAIAAVRHVKSHHRWEFRCIKAT